MSKSAPLRLDSPHVASQVIDGEAIVIHFETGCYYSTEGVGSAILDLVRRQASPDEIVAALVRRSGAPREDVEPAVTRFIDELKQEHLVVEGSAGDSEHEGADRAAAAEDGLTFTPPHLHKYTDLQDLLLLDPIHDTDERGWPATGPARDPAGD